MTSPERVVLVGPGRAGTSLARALLEAGHVIAGVAGGRKESNAAARAELDGAPEVSVADAVASGSFVVLAPPDDQLDAAISSLVGEAAQGTIVVHLAGARGLEAFARTRVVGGRYAAFHPLRSFATREKGRGGLRGAAVAIEAATEVDSARLFALARGIGGAPFALEASSRPLYHAAAAIAGNAPLALLDLAERAFIDAGAPPEVARGALWSLLRAAVDQAERVGPAAALTGPVVRGDAATIARHLEAFSSRDPEERALYATLCRALARLAARRADDGARSSAILDLLDRDPGRPT